MTLMIRQQHRAGMESGEMNTSMTSGCLTEGARQVCVCVCGVYVSVFNDSTLITKALTGKM